MGVILYILLCGYPPFNGPNDQKIIESVKEGKYTFDMEEWNLITEDAKDMVSKLLEYDPSKRITAQEALKHKWIKEKSVMDIDKNIIETTLMSLRNH